MSPKIISKELIHQIRERVISGEIKNRVAKEFGVSYSLVSTHTKDIHIKKDPVIKGKSLSVLCRLLSDGYMFSFENGERYGYYLRKLQLLFPMIQSAHVDERMIYYLEDKKKEALIAVVKHRRSRVINYYDLMQVSKIFEVELEDSEKKHLLWGKTNEPCKIKRLEQGGFLSSRLFSQQKLSIDYDF